MLQSGTFQELTYLVMGLPALQRVRLREVLEHGRRCGDILTCAGKVRDRGVARHYLAVDLPCPGAGPSSALTARELALERLELLLDLLVHLGNFLLPGADLLRSGFCRSCCGKLPAAVPVLGVLDGSSSSLADWAWPSGVSAVKHS